MSGVNQTLSVEEATDALADAITTDERFTTWKQATAALEQDSGMTELMAQYQPLAQKAKDARHGGPAINDEEVQELETIKKQIEANELFIRHHETTAVLLDMLRGINQGLSGKVGLDFAAATAQRGPGCRG